jgi:tetratricopeptide (TPR) repeat protein
MAFLLLVLALLLTGCTTSSDTPNAAAGYVNPRTCEGCHAQIALSYRETGMARGFHKIDIEEVPRTSFTHEKSNLNYQFRTKDDKVYLRRAEPNGDNAVEKEIHYVLGSGNHARTFLHRTPEGRLLEMPVNWYPENGGILAMSPGYDRPDHMDMRRAIGYQCAFCHNGYPNAKGNSLLDDPVFEGELPEGIDCQRCHGPGREHVSQGGRGKILNPKKLSATRQMEVCMQCHLETTSFPLPNSIPRVDQAIFSYNPTQPLENYILHFDHPKATPQQDKFEIAGSAYRLRQSKCFLGSNEKLTCTTCHDPHKKPAANVDSSCQGCHQNIASSAKHPAKSECASCHMPKRRTEDVIHVAVTDHKIQRPDPKLNPMAARVERHEIMGKDSYQGEVVPYYPNTADNDLYPALAQVIHQSNLNKGIPRLEAALQSQQPKHPAFYLHMAQALHSSGQPAKAIPHYNKALSLDPKFLPALRSLGATQLQLNDLNAAKATLEKATTLHPKDSLSWLELARLHRAQLNGAQAVEAARKAIKLEPELVEAHKLLAATLTESGDRTGAEAALRQAIQLQPEEAEARTNLANLLAEKVNRAEANSSGSIQTMLKDQAAAPEAEKHFLAAIRSNPKLISARSNYAIFLANQKRYADALPHALEASSLDPKNLQFLDLLANLHMATRNFREAANTYRQALAINPSFARAQLGLGTAFGAMNNFSAARQFLTQAANSNDVNVQAEAQQLLQTLP